MVPRFSGRFANGASTIGQPISNSRPMSRAFHHGIQDVPWLQAGAGSPVSPILRGRGSECSALQGVVLHAESCCVSGTPLPPVRAREVLRADARGRGRPTPVRHLCRSSVDYESAFAGTREPSEPHMEQRSSPMNWAAVGRFPGPLIAITQCRTGRACQAPFGCWAAGRHSFGRIGWSPTRSGPAMSSAL